MTRTLTEKDHAIVASGFEVGLSYPGHPNPGQEEEALQCWLDLYGAGQDVWLIPPRILEQHVQVAPNDFGRGDYQISVSGCAWAIYGCLRDSPGDDDEFFAPPGVRIKSDVVGA